MQRRQVKITPPQSLRKRSLYESDVAAILANKQKFDEIIAAVNSTKATIDSDQKSILDGRKQVEKSAQEIVTASETGLAHLSSVTESKEASAATLNSVKEALASALTTGAAINAEKARIDKALADTVASVAKISENESVATQHGAGIAKLLSDAKVSDQNLKGVWSHLEESDNLSKTVEETNKKHSQEIDELRLRIEGLLPGATSAGLAFVVVQLQKARFKEPQRRWLWTFITCISLLVILASPSFFAALGYHFGLDKPDTSWDGTLRSLALRLPIFFPLIWLAIYAGRNYMLSLRLEEDYAYKEAISTAFEGYKREMEKIATTGDDAPSPLVTLCANILTAIAERPGRIYEGKQQDITLLTEAGNLAAKTASLSKRQVALS